MRQELESFKARLEVVVDVQIETADLREAERLCKLVEEKDRHLMLEL